MDKKYECVICPVCNAIKTDEGFLVSTGKTDEQGIVKTLFTPERMNTKVCHYLTETPNAAGNTRSKCINSSTDIAEEYTMENCIATINLELRKKGITNA